MPGNRCPVPLTHVPLTWQGPLMRSTPVLTERRHLLKQHTCGVRGADIIQVPCWHFRYRAEWGTVSGLWALHHQGVHRKETTSSVYSKGNVMQTSGFHRCWRLLRSQIEEKRNQKLATGGSRWQYQETKTGGDGSQSPGAEATWERGRPGSGCHQGDRDNRAFCPLVSGQLPHGPLPAPRQLVREPGECLLPGQPLWCRAEFGEREKDEIIQICCTHGRKANLEGTQGQAKDGLKEGKPESGKLTAFSTRR